jgi:hypothetical protein
MNFPSEDLIADKGKKKRRLLSKLNKKQLLVLVVIFFLSVQVLLVVLLVRLSFVSTGSLNNLILSEVSMLTRVSPYELPVIAVIGDVEALRAANTFQAEVYKDAQNGDYVLGFSDQMIIYRRQEGKLIYVGDTPLMRLSDISEEMAAKVAAKARSVGVLSTNSTETPHLSAVSSPEQLKAEDAIFYAQVSVGDVIGVFPEAKVIVVYRPATDGIVSSGKYQTIITPE